MSSQTYVAQAHVARRLPAHEQARGTIPDGDDGRAPDHVVVRSHRMVVGPGARHGEQIARPCAGGQHDVRGQDVAASQCRPTTAASWPASMGLLTARTE